ncbi:MAG: chromosome partitioning protein ParB [Porticoccus sp.]|jgi:ParB family chromosome partitioning protein|nr:chromosome partitioning protein ParB [Porticoccus sp.]
MGKRKGLGRGLDALLAAGREDSDDQTIDDSTKLSSLSVELLVRGEYQPRRDMSPDALDELAGSIKLHGVMQPIVVRKIENQKYEIIAGERRWRAAQIAGLDVVPALVKSVSDDAALAMSLIENVQREDLNAIEEAQALSRLQEEFDLTQQEVANAVSKSRSTVTNLIRLMSLEDEVRKLLEHGDLEMGHARALLSLNGKIQLEAARTAVTKNMNVRQIETYVRFLLQDKSSSTENYQHNPDVKILEEKLSSTLGAQVAIQHNAKGKGKIVLKYNNLEELDGILEHIK